MEKRGVPTVTFVADTFVVLADYEKQGLGLADLPLATVKYPFGGVPAQEARARATAAFDAVVRALTRPVSGERS